MPATGWPISCAAGKRSREDPCGRPPTQWQPGTDPLCHCEERSDVAPKRSAEVPLGCNLLVPFIDLRRRNRHRTGRFPRLLSQPRNDMVFGGFPEEQTQRSSKPGRQGHSLALQRLLSTTTRRGDPCGRPILGVKTLPYKGTRYRPPLSLRGAKRRGAQAKRGSALGVQSPGTIHRPAPQEQTSYREIPTAAAAASE